MPSQQPDHYAVLGVTAHSTFGEIQKAFFKKSLSCHPDKRNDDESEEAHKEFVLISAAYNVLKDSDSRRKYDNTRRTQGTQRPGTSQRSDSDGGNSSFTRRNTSKGPFQSRASQFPGNPWFYADQSEQDARRSQHTRRANRGYPKQPQTQSESTDDPKDTGENRASQPYQVPRHEEKEELSPEEEAWLRYCTAKNNVQGLSFSLIDALYRVLEVIRSLRQVDAIKQQAAKARLQLRFIEISFSSIQVEMDCVHSPIWLLEATVSRINKMVILEENVRELLGMLKARPPGTMIPEQEAIHTCRLLLKALNKWVHLCR